MDPRLLCASLLVLAANLALSSATVRLFAMRASGLSGDPAGNPPDPYLKVWCGSAFGGMTEYYKDTSNPVWHADFYFPNCNANDNLKVEVWDKDLQYDDLLGTCHRRVESGVFYNECPLSKGTVYYNFELI